jgi:hypothetical protein
MLKRIPFLLIVLLLAGSGQAQEIQARLTVMAGKVSSKVDKNIFNSLQTTLSNFINGRKWTKDVYQPNEKIQCNFLLNIDQQHL